MSDDTPKRVHSPHPYRLDKPTGCDIENCERPHHANGLCIPHWQRRQDYGDPLAGPPLRKQRRKSERTGQRGEYHVNHARVRKERGPAWQQECDCGQQAQTWAMKHETSGASPGDYMPLCWSCHAKYDNFVNRLPDNRGSKRSSESREKMQKAMTECWEKPGYREKMREVARLREARKRGEVT